MLQLSRPQVVPLCMFERIRRRVAGWQFLLLTAMAVLPVAGGAFGASSYSVIHHFHETGRVGVTPYSLVSDGAGKFYGITTFGGKSGIGAVYQLSPPPAPGEPWTAKAIYSYRSNGPGPIIVDKAGNIYGVTTSGGRGCDGGGCGTVFKLSPPAEPGSGWTHTDIFLFDGWNGWSPGGLALDLKGNLYGTTYGGGRYCGGTGCGLVYELKPVPGRKQWKMKVLYYFTGVLGQGDGDGSHPYSIAFDDSGVLYGLASYGGHCDRDGCSGAAFSLVSNPKSGQWDETILYRFNFGGYDRLTGAITVGGPGVLYGESVNSLFQLSNTKNGWVENVLTSGDYVYGQVAIGMDGSLYSTSLYSQTYPSGTLFRMTLEGKTWKYELLHAFKSGNDGEAPDAGVVLGIDGALYGTTIRGGNPQPCGLYDQTGCGIVFQFAP